VSCHVFVLGESFLPLFTIFLLEFRAVTKVCHFLFCFSFYLGLIKKSILGFHSNRKMWVGFFLPHFFRMQLTLLVTGKHE
jgi:hypothetical protein